METSNAVMSKKQGRRRARVWVARTLMVCGVALATALLVEAWRPRPTAVDVAEVKRGLLQVVVEEDGMTRVHDHFIIGSPLTGSLARVELHPGDAVERGTVVARLMPLDPPLLDARTRLELEARSSAANAGVQQAHAVRERARLAVDFTGKELERQTRMRELKMNAPTDVERAAFELKTRTMELRSADFAVHGAEHDAQMAGAALRRVAGGKRAAEEVAVRSPVSGMVLRVLSRGGGVVAAGTPLLEVGDPAGLEVVVDVLTADAVRIPVGAHAILSRWGGDHPLLAHVRRVEPAAFSAVSALGVQEQRVNVVLDLDQPRQFWSTLGDGFRVDARIILASIPDALLVPAGALFKRQDAWTAYAVVDGTAVPVAVDVGARSGVEVQVLSGLAAGDRVVVHPGDRVLPGVAVAAR